MTSYYEASDQELQNETLSTGTIEESVTNGGDVRLRTAITQLSEDASVTVSGTITFPSEKTYSIDRTYTKTGNYEIGAWLGNERTGNVTLSVSFQVEGEASISVYIVGYSQGEDVEEWL